jgi:MFS family permease
MITKRSGGSDTNFAVEMKEGIAIVRGHKGIVAMIVVMTMAGFCFGVIQTLSKPLILAFAGDTELGVLTSVCAFGMMAGSILISCRKKIKSQVKLLSVGLIGSGIFFALMGVHENLFWVAGAGFLMFSFMPAVQIGAEVLIRKNLANEVQGRAFGIISFITQLGSIAAYISSGALADYVFEPFMKSNSFLATNIGNIIGFGSGRGIALLLLLSGVSLAVVGIVVGKLKQVKLLEEEKGSHEIIVETCTEGL